MCSRATRICDKKCVPQGSRGRQGQITQKKVLFWARFLTFGAYFSAILGPNGLSFGGNLGTASLKAPAHHGPLTQKKSGVPRARAILAQNDPKKHCFLGFWGTSRAETWGSNKIKYASIGPLHPFMQKNCGPAKSRSTRWTWPG